MFARSGNILHTVVVVRAKILLLAIDDRLKALK
jgi:hypothetical protein